MGGLAEREGFSQRRFYKSLWCLQLVILLSVYTGFKRIHNFRYSFYSFPYSPQFPLKRYHSVSVRLVLFSPIPGDKECNGDLSKTTLLRVGSLHPSLSPRCTMRPHH